MTYLLTRDLTVQHGAALRGLFEYLLAAVSSTCVLPIRVVLLQPLRASPMRIHHPGIPSFLPGVCRDPARQILR